MQTNLMGNKKTDIRYMAQDFEIFGVEFNNLTVETLDKKMEEKIEKLQNWLRNAKYTDQFISEFQTVPQTRQATHLFSQPEVISNFKTILYEYRTLRNWLIYKQIPILDSEKYKDNSSSNQTDEIKMSECNYSINPSQYKIEHILQNWFTELSNPIRSFVMKKFKEYAENDLFYIEIGIPYRGRPWFMDFKTYEEMEDFLVKYSSPCTVEDLQKKLDLLIQRNTLEIKDTGNEFLNSFAFSIERVKRISDLNSLKKFIELIKKGKIKPSKKDTIYKNAICVRAEDQQLEFEAKRKSAIDYLESIKPSNTKNSDYYKNDLFDKYNDVYNTGGLTEAMVEAFIMSKFPYTDIGIQNRRHGKLSQINNEIEVYYREFNHFLEQINTLNSLIKANGQGIGSIDKNEIYRRVNILMNSFINIEDIELIDKIRTQIQNIGLTLSMIKWSNKEPNSLQTIELKTIEEIRQEKEKIIYYLIAIENDNIDFSIALPLIENIYEKYEIVRGCYDYINSNNKNIEIYNDISKKGR